MEQLRPGIEKLSYEGWIGRNFHPGIMSFLTEELGMNDSEIQREYEIWRSYSSQTDPPFFPQMLDLLYEYRNAGGIIAVASHSEADIIMRNYRVASGNSITPDAIYGWELTPERRKPSPWPVLDVLRRFGLDAGGVLVVDDLKPGVDMAREAGVAVAGAGWAYSIPEIQTFMQNACDYYFSSISELLELVVRT